MDIRTSFAIVFFILAITFAILNKDELLSQDPSVEARLLPNSSVRYHDKEVVFLRRLVGKMATDKDVSDNCSKYFVKPETIQNKIQLDVAVLTTTGSSSGSQDNVCIVIRNYYLFDDIRIYIREFRSNDVVMNLSVDRNPLSAIRSLAFDNAAALCLGVAAALLVEIVVSRRDNESGRTEPT